MIARESCRERERGGGLIALQLNPGDPDLEQTKSVVSPAKWMTRDPGMLISDLKSRASSLSQSSSSRVSSTNPLAA